MTVRSRIEAEARWLLVLDNADDLALFGVRQASTRSQSLVDFIPRGPKGTVLWTSRDKQIAGTLVGPHRAIEVADMTPNEAKNLLGITTATSEVKETYELIEDLQYHALAISQAGAYMRRTSTPVREYLFLLREKKKRHKLLEQDEFDIQRKPEVPNSILATWSISIKRIQQECKLALALLHIMALFDTQKIQWGIIQCIIEYYSPRDDDHKTKQAIVRLQDFSFVNLYEKDGDQYYGMHKLVREAARYRLRKRGSPEGGATFWGSKIISEALSYFKERHKRRFSLTALQVLGRLSFISHKDEAASWAVNEFLSTHVLQVTEWMEVCGNGVPVSDHLSHISDFLGDLEKWTEKELVDERVLKIRQKMLGEKHPKAIESMAALTISYLGLASRRRNMATLKFEYPSKMSDHAQYQIGRAEEIGTKVLKLRQEILGPTHPNTIASMQTIAHVYCAQRRYTEAENAIRQILKTQKGFLEMKHPLIVSANEELAYIYYIQGQYDRALGIREEVLELRKEIRGKKHPATILAMYNLAISRYRCGKYREGLALMEQCRQYHLEVCGISHRMAVECALLVELWTGRLTAGGQSFR
jgi:tetratricopeptide (TPR) repeat protein